MEETAKPYSNLITASSLGKLTEKADSIAEILVHDKYLEKVTFLEKGEDLKFALAKQIFDDIKSMKESFLIEDFKATSHGEILRNILKFRESIEGVRSQQLVNTGKIRIETEEQKPRRGKILGFLRRD